MIIWIKDGGLEMKLWLPETSISYTNAPVTHAVTEFLRLKHDMLASSKGSSTDGTASQGGRG